RPGPPGGPGRRDRPGHDRAPGPAPGPARGRRPPGRTRRRPAARPGVRRPLPARRRHAQLLLDRVDARHAGRRHRPGAAGRGVLPGRRRHGRPVAGRLRGLNGGRRPGRTGGAPMTTIAVTADTHDEIVKAGWGPVMERLGELFAGADLIVHCGDITTARVLDDLRTIAPVLAVRNDGDPPPDPPGLVDGPTVVTHGGIDIRVVFELPDGADLGQLFGRPVR